MAQPKDVRFDEFAAQLPRVPFEPDSVIFREGDKGQSAFLVARGEVIICTKNSRGELIHLTTLTHGQMFGELALLNQSVRTATAITETGCELLVIRQAHLRERLADADPVLRFWIDYLVSRVVDLSKRVDPSLAPPPPEDD